MTSTIRVDRETGRRVMLFSMKKPESLSQKEHEEFLKLLLRSFGFNVLPEVSCG